MKYIYILLFMITLGHSVRAQINQGIVTYSKGIVQVTGQEKESYTQKYYKPYLSHFENLNYILKFTSTEAVFFQDERVFLEDNALNRVIIGAGNGSGIRYVNFKSKLKLHQLDAFGARFLVQSKLDKTPWKLQNESKLIGKYLCYKASTVYTVINRKGTFYHPVEVWYTPQIPVPLGPIGYGGLPGLIVELNVRSIKYAMTGIDLNPNKKIAIKKPKRGKLVTKAEYKAIGREAMGNFGN